ncbi:MAG: hypothetical protein KGQ49_01625 [Verrucomicrobia bacterium]|nr:hypothetical protein [Verrucomicrobiota bacterium]MBU6446081.1 hypothetical protein [Verrucomicrobiota bacterium]
MSSVDRRVQQARWAALLTQVPRERSVWELYYQRAKENDQRLRDLEKEASVDASAFRTLDDRFAYQQSIRDEYQLLTKACEDFPKWVCHLDREMEVMRLKNAASSEGLIPEYNAWLKGVKKAFILSPNYTTREKFEWQELFDRHFLSE